MTTPTPDPERRRTASVRRRIAAVACGGVLVATGALSLGGCADDDLDAGDPAVEVAATSAPDSTPGAPTPAPDPDGDGGPDAAPGTDGPDEVPPVDQPGEVTKILVVGDSVSAQIGWALQFWTQKNPDRIEVWNESHIGCGTVRYGFKRVGTGDFGPVGEVCSNWAEPVPVDTVAQDEVVSWPTAIEVFQPDIVVIIVSGWDATDRIVPGVVDDWATIGDPTYDAYVRDEHVAATDVLTSTGATLYWLVAPVLNLDTAPPDHAARIAGLNRIVREAAGEFDDRDVRFLDYPVFVGEIGSDRERRIRDDGVHLSVDGFFEVPGWLLGELGLADAP